MKNKAAIGAFLLLTTLSVEAGIQNGEMIKIWPGIAPGSEGVLIQEEIVERSKTPEIIRDRAGVKTLTPTLTAYVPKNPNGVGILVMPGGGYARVVLDKESDELSSWLDAEGVTFFVLKYRLPGDGHENREIVALQDAQRAMRVIRGNTEKWNLNPEKIGIMGFSAGGHLASTLSAKYDEKIYKQVDEFDNFTAKPNFQILGYPVITMKDPHVHKGSRTNLLGENPSEEMINRFSSELNATEMVPKTYIMHATDDRSVPVENSIDYYLALKSKGVPVEMHIFQDGGHGYSIRGTKGKTVESWTETVSKWLKINVID